VELVSDSEYVVKGFTEYLPKWRKRGWRNSGGGSVANRALWEQLIVAVARHRNVCFKWTKGHDGTEGNEHAHRLASQARRVAEGLD
jgi:ribonuclease HI